ncbi:hypothetical protein IWX49DRAFT_558083 [Phyllosticta citricarpa]
MKSTSQHPCYHSAASSLRDHVCVDAQRRRRSKPWLSVQGTKRPLAEKLVADWTRESAVAGPVRKGREEMLMEFLQRQSRSWAVVQSRAQPTTTGRLLLCQLHFNQSRSFRSGLSECLAAWALRSAFCFRIVMPRLLRERGWVPVCFVSEVDVPHMQVSDAALSGLLIHLPPSPLRRFPLRRHPFSLSTAPHPMAHSPGTALRKTWRETLGNHIYLGTKSPAWTDQDRRIFLVYAARYKWTQALQLNDAGSKNLQKELLMYTAHRGLNDAIMVDMVHAIRYFLLSLSLSLPHYGPSLIQTSPSDRATLEQVRRGFENLYQWPDWTKRWFLNPWWDGETNEPRANGPGPRLDLFPHNASDEGRQTIDVLAHWDHMTDEEKDMCFEAARAAAQEGQNPTTALLGRYPVRRMVFALPGLN